jgi:hypothetical protein
MKYAVEMSLVAIPGFMNIGSGIQKVDWGGGGGETHKNRPVSPKGNICPDKVCNVGKM